MKKIFTIMMIAVLAIGVASCNKDKAHEEQQKQVEMVVAKMKENDKISQEEYAASIQYATQAFKDMVTLWQTECSTEEKVKLTEEYNAKYPDLAYVQVLLIEDGKPTDMDESNEKLYAEMMEAYKDMNEKNPFPLIEGVREDILRQQTRGLNR